MEKREPLYTVGGSVNWCSYHGNQYGDSSKKKKKENTITIWFQQFHFCIFIHWKKTKTLIWKDTCIPMFTGALFTIAKIRTQPKLSISVNTHTHIHTHTGILFSHKKRMVILPPLTTRMDPENNYTIWSHLYVKTKKQRNKPKLTDTENRWVVAGEGGRRWGGR